VKVAASLVATTALLGGVMVFNAPASNAAPSPASTITNVFYGSTNAGCLSATVDKPVTSNGTAFTSVVLSSCGGTFNSAAQQWTYDSTTEQVKNVFYNECLSATSDKPVVSHTVAFPSVVLAACGSTFNAAAQQWTYDSVSEQWSNVYYSTAPQTGGCMSATVDTPITSGGTAYPAVVINTCGSTFNATAQQWTGTTFTTGAALPYTGVDVPTLVTIDPGSSATVPVTIKDSGPTYLNVSFPSSAVVFTAPTGSTFPAQSTVDTQFSSDGITYVASTLTLTGCIVSDAGSTLTCTPGGPANLSFQAGEYSRFNPTVKVDSGEAANTVLPAGSVDFQFTSSSSPGQTYDASQGTLNVQTPSVDGTPIIASWSIGSAAALLLLLFGGFAVVRRRRGRPGLSSL
jgi:hypothetical protein